MPSERWPYRNNGTHVENLEDPSEVQSPARNFILVVLRVDMPRNHIPFSLLGDLPLDLLYSPIRSKGSSMRYPKGIFAMELTHSVV